MKQYDVNSSLVTGLPSPWKNYFHHVAYLSAWGMPWRNILTRCMWC